MQTGELLDLREIPTQDLKILIEVCAGYPANKFFEDNFVILTRILFSKHECSEMAEYREHDLMEALATFDTLLDQNQLSPEHPTRKFLQFNLSAAYGELERRKGQATNGDSPNTSPASPLRLVK